MASCTLSPAQLGRLALQRAPLVDQLLLQRRVGDPAVELERQVDAAVGAEAELPQLGCRSRLWSAVAS